jgi:hypothetical protein
MRQDWKPNEIQAGFLDALRRASRELSRGRKVEESLAEGP